MIEARFTEQTATENILLRVTNVCSVCFADLHEGETIHYDNEMFRYVCSECADKIIEEMRYMIEIEVLEEEKSA